MGKHGAVLAVPSDEKENKKIADAIKNYNAMSHIVGNADPDYIWVGLKHVVEYPSMELQLQGTTQTYMNWDGAAPDTDTSTTNDGYVKCIEMLPTGKWKEAECLIPKHFVCDFGSAA